MSHTPGPWKTNFSRINGEVTHWHVTDAMSGSLNAVALADEEQGHLRSTEELTANARLIASAPDLLAALQECADTFRGYVMHHAAKGDGAKEAANQYMVEVAEAAIAKATGEPA